MGTLAHHYLDHALYEDSRKAHSWATSPPAAGRETPAPSHQSSSPSQHHTAERGLPAPSFFWGEKERLDHISNAVPRAGAHCLRSWLRAHTKQHPLDGWGHREPAPGACSSSRGPAMPQAEAARARQPVRPRVSNILAFQGLPEELAAVLLSWGLMRPGIRCLEAAENKM